MKIIKIFGGTANAMFQYALYMKLSIMGENVYLHDCMPANAGDIKRFFELPWPEADEKSVQKLADIKTNMTSRLRRKIFGRKKSHYVQITPNYDTVPFEDGDRYLVGYWQTEHYFDDIRPKIIDVFDFSKILEKCENLKLKTTNEVLLNQIREDNSVSLHIRRGDYVENELFYKIYGNICTFEYYEKAMKYFRDKGEAYIFYVFSNDPAWVREQALFQSHDCVIVDCNQAKDIAVYDMMLMKNCKHNIIANSSFSWWGAWMNENVDKEVIAPTPWLNTMAVNDIYCKGWRVIHG